MPAEPDVFFFFQKIKTVCSFDPIESNGWSLSRCCSSACPVAISVWDDVVGRGVFFVVRWSSAMDFLDDRLQQGQVAHSSSIMSALCGFERPTSPAGGAFVGYSAPLRCQAGRAWSSTPSPPLPKHTRTQFPTFLQRCPMLGKRFPNNPQFKSTPGAEDRIRTSLAILLPCNLTPLGQEFAHSPFTRNP